MLDSKDADLVRRAQAGDVAAVGDLYDRHHKAIFRYVQSRVHGKDLAEDLTGEIFTRMVANLPDYRPMGVPFRAWLYRIAHNLVVDHYRKEGGQVLVPLDHADGLAGEEILTLHLLVCGNGLTFHINRDGFMSAVQFVHVEQVVGGCNPHRFSLGLDQGLPPGDGIGHGHVDSVRPPVESVQYAGRRNRVSQRADPARPVDGPFGDDHADFFRVEGLALVGLV